MPEKMQALFITEFNNQISQFRYMIREQIRVAAIAVFIKKRRTPPTLPAPPLPEGLDVLWILPVFMTSVPPPDVPEGLPNF